jgi:hypothetical protein
MEDLFRPPREIGEKSCRYPRRISEKRITLRWRITLSDPTLSPVPPNPVRDGSTRDQVVGRNKADSVYVVNCTLCVAPLVRPIIYHGDHPFTNTCADRVLCTYCIQ